MKFRQVPMGAWYMLSYFWPVFSYPLVHFSGEKTILPYFSSLSMVAISVSFPEVRNRKVTESGLNWIELALLTFFGRENLEEATLEEIEEVCSQLPFQSFA